MTQRTIKPINDSARMDLTALARTHLIGAVDTLLKTFAEGTAPKSSFGRPGSPEQADLRSTYLRLRNVAEALMLWHSSNDFVNDDGMPKTLSRTGPKSLWTLALRVARKRRAAMKLLSDLIELELVESRPGGLVPSKRSAVIGTSNALALAYATIAVSRMTGTMAYNFSGGSPPRYERQVSDVSIRATDLPVFLRFVEQQGQYLIDAVDDWLAKREFHGSRGKRSVSVGIGAFAWVDTYSGDVKTVREASARAHSRK